MICDRCIYVKDDVCINPDVIQDVDGNCLAYQAIKGKGGTN